MKQTASYGLRIFIAMAAIHVIASYSFTAPSRSAHFVNPRSGNAGSVCRQQQPNPLVVQLFSNQRRVQPIMPSFSTALAAQAEENKKETSEQQTNNNSGWKNALMMGPPLVIKLCVVMLVKFVTDVVIFPALFLYRFLRLIQKKILSMFSTTKIDDEQSSSNKKISSAEDLDATRVSL